MLISRYEKRKEHEWGQDVRRTVAFGALLARPLRKREKLSRSMARAMLCFLEVTMEKLGQIYEGKAKKVYATADPDLVIVSYKDDATAQGMLSKSAVVSANRASAVSGAHIPLPRKAHIVIIESAGTHS